MNIVNFINKMNDLYGTETAPKRFDTTQWLRPGFRGGQLVDHGPEGVRQGYGPKSQKLRKPEMRRQPTFKPHEVTIYRKAVEIRAKKRDLRVPDWDNYPTRGYPSDYTLGQTISKDVGRKIRAGRIEKVGTGSGATAETLLSKVDQDKIKKRFGSKYEGEWNFLTKKNKTGNKFGLPKKGNEELYQQIVNYIKGRHGPNFAFDSFDSANYHLMQMHRAANLKVKPNKNYVPIYGTKGIIGYIDRTQKGKEYYHADYTGVDSKGNKALLINKHHPDAPELNKLINIVEGTKQEYDEILGPLFKKHGYETPNLNQLIDALLETEGRYDIASSIERHHQYGVGTRPGKIQLVTRDQNQLAKLVEGRIKAGKMDAELAHRILRPSGTQIVVDGKKIGAPDIAPEKQIADWKKWTRRKTLADPIKMLTAAGFNVDKCKSSGGRVGYQNAGPVKGVNVCIRNVINKEMELAKSGGKGSKEAAEKFTKFGKTAKGLGVALAWADIPIELGFALPHLLAGDIQGAKRATTAGWFGWGGKPLDEIDRKENPEAYKYFKHKQDLDAWMDAFHQEQTASSKLGELPEGYAEIYKKHGDKSGYVDFQIDQFNKASAKQEFIAKNYQGYLTEEGEQDFEAEDVGRQKAKDYVTGTVKKGWAKGSDMGPLFNIALGLPPEGIKLKAHEPTTLKEQIEQQDQPHAGAWWGKGVLSKAEELGDPELYSDWSQRRYGKDDPRDIYSELPLEWASQLSKLEAEETRKQLRKIKERKFWEPWERSPYAMAGGGLANLTRTVAPDSGPMSGGLRSLYIDDMDY